MLLLRGYSKPIFYIRLLKSVFMKGALLWYIVSFIFPSKVILRPYKPFLSTKCYTNAFYNKNRLESL